MERKGLFETIDIIVAPPTPHAVINQNFNPDAVNNKKLDFVPFLSTLMFFTNSVSGSVIDSDYF